jgi:hypothetical protein
MKKKDFVFSRPILTAILLASHLNATEAIAQVDEPVNSGSTSIKKTIKTGFGHEVKFNNEKENELTKNLMGSNQQINQQINLDEFMVLFVDVGDEILEAWRKLRLTLGLNIFEGSLDLGNLGGEANLQLGGGLRYNYVSQPAFIDGKYQRLDIYRSNMNLGLAHTSGTGLSTQAEIKITFSRLTEDKKSSILALPYFVQRFPITSEVAKKKLEPGDAVRLEVSSSGTVGFGRGDSFGSDTVKSTVGLGLSGSRSALFLADFYKMKNDRIRTRLVMSRNLAALYAGVNLSVFDLFDTGTGLVDRILKRVFKCNILSLGKNSSPFYDYPTDTLMVDYVFNLQTPEGSQAYDAMLAHLRSLDFLAQLNWVRTKNWSTDQQVLEELVRFTGIAEKVFSDSLDKRPIDRAVNRLFKGRTQSDIDSFVASSQCGPGNLIWKAHLNKAENSIGITHYLPSNQIENFALNSASRSGEIEVVKSEGGKEFRSLDVLLNANRTQDRSGKNKFVPTSVSDILLTKDIRENSLTPFELELFQTELYYQSPEIFSLIDWSKFIGDRKTKTNVGLKYQFVFHDTFLKILPRIEKKIVKERLISYIEALPEAFRTRLPHDRVTTCDQGRNCSETMFRFNEDITIISNYIAKVLEATDTERKARDFKVLQRMSLFNEIGVGFMLSLVPRPFPDGLKLEDLVFMRLDANAENNAALNFTFGQNDITKLYGSVLYILSLINDRGFDLRLQVDELTGVTSPFYPLNSSKSDCVNCM